MFLPFYYYYFFYFYECISQTNSKQQITAFHNKKKVSNRYQYQYENKKWNEENPHHNQTIFFSPLYLKMKTYFNFRQFIVGKNCYNWPLYCCLLSTFACTFFNFCFFEKWMFLCLVRMNLSSVWGGRFFVNFSEFCHVLLDKVCRFLFDGIWKL